jgi:hypothetical protein
MQASCALTMSGPSSSTWRSTKQGRVAPGWSQSDCTKLAEAWVEAIPDAALTLMKQLRLTGDLVELDPVVDPSTRDVAKNMIWIKPVCRLHPGATPSAFLLADALIEFDNMMGNGALGKGKIVDSLTRNAAALDNAHKIKRLIGKVRRLFRQSTSSRNPDITEIKGWLQKRRRSTEDLLQAPDGQGRGEGEEDSESCEDGSDADAAIDAADDGVDEQDDGVDEGDSEQPAESEHADSEGDLADSDQLRTESDEDKLLCKKPRTDGLQKSAVGQATFSLPHCFLDPLPHHISSDHPLNYQVDGALVAQKYGSTDHTRMSYMYSCRLF